LWDAIRLVRRAHRDLTPKELKERTLDVLGELLREGLICAGFPQGEPLRFVATHKLASEIIQEIRQEWDALGREPTIGDVIWFTSPDRATYV
jgi:hypothetical protein